MKELFKKGTTMKKILPILFTFLAFLFFNCGGSGEAVSPELRTELDAYKKEITAQREMIVKLKKQLDAEAKKDFSSLKGDITTNKTDIRRTRTAINSLQSAMEDMRSASPLIDSTNRILLDDIQMLKSQLNELSSKMGMRNSSVPVSTAVNNRNSGSAGTVKALSPRELRAAYVNTLSKFQNGRYAEASAGFEDIIRSNPSSDLTDNAQYWIGESLYMQKKYEQAIVAFEKVFSYSDRGKFDYAQFKLGLCYRKLGDDEKARDELERLINYYKDSELRSQAQNILNKMR